MRGGSLSWKQPFSFHLLLSYCYSLLNLLIHLFVILFGTVSCLCYLSCHKTLITEVLRLKRSRTEYVPVLGLQLVSIPLWEKYMRAQTREVAVEEFIDMEEAVSRKFATLMQSAVLSESEDGDLNAILERSQSTTVLRRKAVR